MLQLADTQPTVNSVQENVYTIDKYIIFSGAVIRGKAPGAA